LRDDLTAAGDVAVGSATGEGVDGASIAVVATRWARARGIARLAVFDDLVAALLRAVLVVVVRAARGATAVVALALGKQLVTAGDVAVVDAASERIDGAGGSVVAGRGTERGGIAGFAWLYHAVPAVRAAVAVIGELAVGWAAAVVVEATRDLLVVTGESALVGAPD
jgi:hypothetical protein